MKKSFLSVLTALLVIFLLPITAHASGVDPNPVSLDMAGTVTTYATIDEAVTYFKATPGNDGIITLAGGTYSSAGFQLESKNLEITTEATATIELVDSRIQIYGGTLLLENLTVNMTNTGNTAFNLIVGRNGRLHDSEFIIDNSTVTLDAGSNPASRGIGHQGAVGSNSVFTIRNNSVVTVTGYSNNAYFTESEATNTLNIEDSEVNFNNNLKGSMVTGTGSGVTVKVTGSTLNVNNNGGNGSNGGHFTIEDSTVNFIGNGAHGLSATNLTINNSEVTTNENAYAGLVVTAGVFNAGPGSVVEVNENFVRHGSGALTINSNQDSIMDAGSVITIEGNKGTGLKVQSSTGAGSFTAAEGAKLTVKDNIIAPENNWAGNATGAGIFVDGGTVVIPSTAVVYNNWATEKADDIYVDADAIEFTFHQANPDGSSWVLNETRTHVGSTVFENGHVIDGWYVDEAANRWSAHNTPIYVVEYTDYATTYVPNGTALSLKAAHTLLTEIEVEKVWENGPTDRPTVIFELFADGEAAVDYLGNVVPQIELANGQTTYTVVDLPALNGDQEIVYTVDEATVPENYEKTVSEDGLTITNSYVIPLTEVPVEKFGLADRKINQIPPLSYTLMVIWKSSTR